MTEAPSVLTPDVLVIGGGPAGLTAAAALARTASVLVLEREQQAGGIPRHSNHPGYGLRDLHRFVSGPEYAARLVDQAARAGADVRTQSMVYGWSDDGSALVTAPTGRLAVQAKAIVLATGARERPRAARLIPGDRPSGIYTTGQLQNLVHLQHESPGRQALVVGAELVSWSAVITLREAGCRTVLMTTAHPKPESYAAFNLAGRHLLRTPIATRSRVVNVIGSPALRAVEIEHLDTGTRRIVECDTLVFTGAWIPDHELARLAGLAMDPGTRGPLVDTALRTSRPDIFAAGNLLHPVDTADVAALDGRHVATQVTRFLGGHSPIGDAVRLLAAPPFRWIAPGLVRTGDGPPPRGRLLLWSNEFVRHPYVSVRQGGREIAARRTGWPASPGRVFRIPQSLLRDARPGGGDVSVGLRR